MYGTQATCIEHSNKGLFENDVKMYGTQAILDMDLAGNRLRMM